jgi:hypothetical protein
MPNDSYAGYSTRNRADNSGYRPSEHLHEETDREREREYERRTCLTHHGGAAFHWRWILHKECR